MTLSAFHKRLPALLVLAGCGFLHVPRAAASPIELLVPAYIYPGGANLAVWDQLIAAASRAGVTAIINPNNGPYMNDASAQAQYQSLTDELHLAGGRMIGYITTGYGSKALSAVQDEVDDYLSKYALDGFFFDEMASAFSAADLSLNTGIYNYVKGLDSQYRVIQNPGTVPDEAYMAAPVADVMTMFEDTGAAFQGFAPPAWASGYSPDQFAIMIHSADQGTMLEAIQNAQTLYHASLVYVTDATLAQQFGPYSTLPTYWEQEVSAAAPEPSTLLLVGGSLAILAWQRRARTPDRRGRR